VTYGWSRLSFHNCTHLTHGFVASNNGSVLDSATLFKNRTCGVATTKTSNGMGASAPTATGVVSEGMRERVGILELVIAGMAAVASL
jgi:hypothetical protein